MGFKTRKCFKTGGESGIRNHAGIENKGSLLFSVLSYLNNRSFRRGLTHELARLGPSSGFGLNAEKSIRVVFETCKVEPIVQNLRR